jgi:hypothetical protein
MFNFVKSQAVKTETPKPTVVWDVTPDALVDGYEYFGETSCGTHWIGGWVSLRVSLGAVE